MQFFTTLFATLFVLELVLGVDNVIFISILTNKLPKQQQNKARILGLTLAMVLRIGLVLVAGWIITLENELFTLLNSPSENHDLDTPDELVSELLSRGALSARPAAAGNSPAALAFVPLRDADAFLDSLSEEIYTSTLAQLCPDNMRGSYCRQPLTCLGMGRFFACPHYAVTKKCKQDGFAHEGYLHATRPAPIPPSSSLRQGPNGGLGATTNGTPTSAQMLGAYQGEGGAL